MDPLDLEWTDINKQLQTLSDLFQADKGAHKRIIETNTFLKPVFHELSRLQRNQVSTRLAKAFHNVQGALDEWRQHPRTTTKRSLRTKSSETIPENIVEMIPSAIELIDMFQLSQPESSWSFKIPQVVFERAIKDVVKAAGDTGSARKWAVEVRASLVYERWETFGPKSQFKLLVCTYRQVVALSKLRGTREKQKHQPTQHLYPALSQYGAIVGLQLTSSVSWASMTGLIAKLRQALRQTSRTDLRLAGWRALLLPLWTTSLGREARRAIFFRVDEAYQTVMEARKTSGGNETDREWEVRFKLVPTTYDLLKTAQWYELDETWTTNVDRTIFDEALSDAVSAVVASTRSNFTSTRRLTSLKIGPVYREWENIAPSLQLAILDYTYVGIYQLEKWDHDPETESTWHQQLFLPEYYLKLSGLSVTDDQATGSPEQHPWKPARRGLGELARVVSRTGSGDENRDELGSTRISRKRRSSPSACPQRRRLARQPRSSESAHTSPKPLLPLAPSGQPPHATSSNFLPTQGLPSDDDFHPRYDFRSPHPALPISSTPQYAPPLPANLPLSRHDSQSFNPSNFESTHSFAAHGGQQAFS